jgi:hypothetical protein
MLEQILKSGGSELLSQLGSKFNIDKSVGSKILDVSGDTLKSGLGKEVLSGNFDGILALLNGKGGSAASALSGSLTKSLVGNLLDKVGLKNEMAQQVATMVVSFVVDSFAKKQPKGGFSVESLTEMFKSSAGDMLKNKASDLLKGGLGGLFK